MDLRTVLVLCLAVTMGGAAPAAISIQNFEPATNDRFANDPSFAGAAFDWSGVGRSTDGKWAVMISPNVFLSATHLHAGIGATLSFFAGNDPGATPVTGTIGGGQQIGGTDLWLGYLDSALPASIASYGWMTVPLTAATFGGSFLDDQFAYLSGISPTTGTYGASPLTNQAVGTNRIEGFIDGLTVSGSTGDVVVLVENLSSDPGYSWTTFESDLNGGDSGSPLMVIAGGNLVVAGIAWASGTVDIDPGAGIETRNAAAYTYTGNHAGAIQSYLGAHPVPEPGFAGMLAAAAVLVSARRKGRPSGGPTRPLR